MSWRTFFATLWHGKYKILVCICLSVAVAWIVFQNKPREYHSRIFYEFNHVPDFLGWKDAARDFEEAFTSYKTYAAWKKENPSTKLEFTHTSDSKVISGIRLSKTPNERLMSFSATQTQGVVSINTDNLQILNEIFMYSQYVNRHITENWASLVENEIQLIREVVESEKVNAVIAKSKDMPLKRIIGLSRYLAHSRQGQNVLIISHPEYPTQHPQINSIISWAVVFGLLIGSSLVTLPSVFGTWRTFPNS